MEFLTCRKSSVHVWLFWLRFDPSNLGFFRVGIAECRAHVGLWVSSWRLDGVSVISGHCGIAALHLRSAPHSTLHTPIHTSPSTLPTSQSALHTQHSTFRTSDSSFTLLRALHTPCPAVLDAMRYLYTRS